MDNAVKAYRSLTEPGVEAWQALKAGFSALMKAADREDDPNGLLACRVGDAFRDGEGTAPNLPLAIEWYTKARQPYKAFGYLKLAELAKRRGDKQEHKQMIDGFLTEQLNPGDDDEMELLMNSGSYTGYYWRSKMLVFQDKDDTATTLLKDLITKDQGARTRTIYLMLNELNT